MPSDVATLWWITLAVGAVVIVVVAALLIAIVVAANRVDQAVFDRLSQRHGTRWLVELTVTAGHFGLISGINNAFEVPPSPSGDQLSVGSR